MPPQCVRLTLDVENLDGDAFAMKVLVIELVRALGVPTIRTFHHPDDSAPIALNRPLGYVDRRRSIADP